MFGAKLPFPLRVINVFKDTSRLQSGDITFPVVVGKVEGDKQRESDLKTPEGIYWITREIPKSQMEPRHGTAAFNLNYPNPIDVLEKKTGQGIWIHGTNEPDRVGKGKDTLGCVVSNNQNVTNLGVKTWDVVRVFAKEVEALELGKSATVSDTAAWVENWRSSWENKKLDEYINLYDETFYADGLDREGWRKKKDYLNHRYASIRVKLDRITWVSHPKYDVVIFHQDYQSSGLKSRGNKALFIKNGKIVTEKFLGD